jgi:hypothetical protein
MSSTVDATTAEEEITYAPAAAPARRAAVRRAVRVLAVAAAILGTMWALPPLWRHAEIVQLKRDCMKYDAAGGTVVCETRPDRADRLLDDPRYQPMTSRATARSEVPRGAALVPESWSELCLRLSPPGVRSDGTAFLGVLRRPDGVRRLVGVDIGEDGVAGRWNLRWTTIEPGGPVGRPFMRNFDVTYPFPPDSPPIRVFAGLRDPADPSHFSIEFHSDHGRCFIEGWLRDDDTVLLEPREDS